MPPSNPTENVDSPVAAAPPVPYEEGLKLRQEQQQGTEQQQESSEEFLDAKETNGSSNTDPDKEGAAAAAAAASGSNSSAAATPNASNVSAENKAGGPPPVPSQLHQQQPPPHQSMPYGGGYGHGPPLSHGHPGGHPGGAAAAAMYGNVQGHPHPGAPAPYDQYYHGAPGPQYHMGQQQPQHPPYHAQQQQQQQQQPPLGMTPQSYYDQQMGASAGGPGGMAGRPSYPPRPGPGGPYGGPALPPHMTGGPMPPYGAAAGHAGHGGPYSGHFDLPYGQQQQRGPAGPAGHQYPTGARLPGAINPATGPVHVGEEYSRRHSPAAREKAQAQAAAQARAQATGQTGIQSAQDSKVQEQDTNDTTKGDAESSTKINVVPGSASSAEDPNNGAAAIPVAPATAKDAASTVPVAAVVTAATANAGAAATDGDVAPPLHNRRASSAATAGDLAADDSHPEADDVEPLPPKALFHTESPSAADKKTAGVEEVKKEEDRVEAVVKAEVTDAVGAVNPSVSATTPAAPTSAAGSLKSTDAKSKRPERHVGFEGDNLHPELQQQSHGPSSSFHYQGANGRPSYPPPSYGRDYHAAGGGGGPNAYPHALAFIRGANSNGDVPAAASSYGPSPPHHYPPSSGSYGPPPPHQQSHQQQYFPGGPYDQQGFPPPAHSPYYAEYRPSPAGEYRPAVNLRGNESKDDKGDAPRSGREETPGSSMPTETPRQHSYPSSDSPYYPNAYTPYGGRPYQPPPSGMRIGGSAPPSASRYQYDHSPLDANPDRSKPPVTPHGYHYSEGPGDVRGAMDRLVATPGSVGKGLLSSGSQYDDHYNQNRTPYSQHSADFSFAYGGSHMTPSFGRSPFSDFPNHTPFHEGSLDGPQPSPLALDKGGDLFRPAASPITRSGRDEEQQNFTPLRFDRAHPLPSASKGADSLLPSPYHPNTFSGGITYATPLVRRKGGDTVERGGLSTSAAEAAATAQQHHFFHNYDGPPSPEAGYPFGQPRYASYPDHVGTGGFPSQEPTADGKIRSKKGKKRKGEGGAAGPKKSKKDKKESRTKMYSQYVGVTYNKTHAKFQACITHYRKQHYLGRYKLAVDAARAYDESAKLLKGSGWKVNFGSMEEYDLAKKKEIDALIELEEKEAEEHRVRGMAPPKRPKKHQDARSLAKQIVKVQVPQSVYTVVKDANGPQAMAAAQAQIAKANERFEASRALAGKKTAHFNTISPHGYAQMPQLPSKTPMVGDGQFSTHITPSPSTILHGEAGATDISFTPSQGGGDIAASAHSTPHSELRPTNIADKTGGGQINNTPAGITRGPSTASEVVTPQEGTPEAAATKALMSLVGK